jgi:hypothetical protein
MELIFKGWLSKISVPDNVTHSDFDRFLIAVLIDYACCEVSSNVFNLTFLEESERHAGGLRTCNQLR